MDLLAWIVLEIGLGFLFYVTGMLILRIASLGKFNAQIMSFRNFKE